MSDMLKYVCLNNLLVFKSVYHILLRHELIIVLNVTVSFQQSHKITIQLSEVNN